MTRSQRDPEAPLDIDAQAPRLATVRLPHRAGDRRLTTAIWTVAVLVALAVLKPWGVGSPEPIGGPAGLPATANPATPVPTEDRTADGLASAVCLGAGAWQIASLETWRTQDVRVWRAIEPIAGASGADDPAIPAVPIVALQVAALGWCAPAYGPNRPAGPATVTAWYVRDGLVTDLHLHQVRPPEGVTQLGGLYVPLTACPEQAICAPLLREPVPGAWVTGRVVFRYLDEASGAVSWLAADVEILAPAVEAVPSARIGS